MASILNSRLASVKYFYMVRGVRFLTTVAVRGHCSHCGRARPLLPLCSCTALKANKGFQQRPTCLNPLFSAVLLIFCSFPLNQISGLHFRIYRHKLPILTPVYVVRVIIPLRLVTTLLLLMIGRDAGIGRNPTLFVAAYRRRRMPVHRGRYRNHFCHRSFLPL